jgi:hypothetical protein
MRMTTLVVVLAIALAALSRSTSADAASASCSLNELRVLQLPPPRVDTVDGWVLEADYDAAMRAACRRVPGRWSYVGNDFLRATRLVDRLYPGMGAWARSCAASEGGYGRWVPNSSRLGRRRMAPIHGGHVLERDR